MSNMEQLQTMKDVIKKHKKKFLSIPYVHSICIRKETVNGEETGKIAITAYVYTKIDEKKLKNEEVFAKVVGQIDDSIVTDVQEKAPPREEYLTVSKARLETEADKKKYRPLIGGCRVATESEHYYHFGTGGFIGTSATDSEKKCIVTNYHVVNESMDNKVYQPEVTEENYIGDVGNTAYTALVDGAQVRLNSGIGSENKIIEIGAVAGTKDPAIDDLVEKYGSTTQLTAGKITGLSYSGTTSGGREFDDQVIISKRNSSDPRLSDSGDSGSAWVLSEGNQIVGLHWGGDGIGDEAYACPIGDVESELSVDVATD